MTSNHHAPTTFLYPVVYWLPRYCVLKAMFEVYVLGSITTRGAKEVVRSTSPVNGEGLSCWTASFQRLLPPSLRLSQQSSAESNHPPID